MGLDVDWVFVNCWAARGFDVQRGEIVIFISPKGIMSPDRKYCILHERLFPEPAEYVIKRVIALEGDEVEPSSDAASSSVVTLKRGAAWVEGDNAQNSIDSNTYGPICLGLVVGKASHVIWPPGYRL